MKPKIPRVNEVKRLDRVDAYIERLEKSKRAVELATSKEELKQKKIEYVRALNEFVSLMDSGKGWKIKTGVKIL